MADLRELFASQRDGAASTPRVPPPCSATLLEETPSMLDISPLGLDDATTASTPTVSGPEAHSGDGGGGEVAEVDDRSPLAAVDEAAAAEHAGELGDGEHRDEPAEAGDPAGEVDPGAGSEEAAEAGAATETKTKKKNGGKKKAAKKKVVKKPKVVKKKTVKAVKTTKPTPSKGSSSPQQKAPSPEKIVAASPKAIVSFPSIKDEVICDRCKTPCDPLRARVMGKSASGSEIRFCCKTCNIRCTQLYRVFGSWPIQQFKELSETQKTEFMRKVKDCSSAKDLQSTAVHTMISQRTEQQMARQKGTYQPLSWYAAQGYDAALIKEKCKDTEMHEVLGLTYKVSLKTEAKTTIEETIRSELYKLIENNKGKRKRGSAGAVDDDYDDDAMAESDDEQKSSAPKSQKDLMKLAKLQEKEASAAARKETQRIAKVKTDSAKFQAKVQGPLALLEKTLKNHKADLSMLPPYVTEGAKNKLAKLKEIMASSSKALKEKTPYMNFSVAEVQSTCVEAAEASKLVSTMSKAIASFKG